MWCGVSVQAAWYLVGLSGRGDATTQQTFQCQVRSGGSFMLVSSRLCRGGDVGRTRAGEQAKPLVSWSLACQAWAFMLVPFSGGSFLLSLVLGSFGCAGLALLGAV